jgi:choline dehydrogenase-like flavoprotein
MFMHGLALPASLQRDEGLLNCALFMLERHAPDDPFLAFKRIVQGNSLDLASDLFCMLKSPAPVLKGLGIKAFQSKNIPEGLKHVLIDMLIKSNPNFAVRELLHRGVQYRLLGMRVEGIAEQCPDPENRLTLSHAKDELGVPLARIHWKVDTLARRSLARLGQLFSSEMSRVGLPVPTLESWIAEGQWAEAPVIDMAHTMGTTRMSTNPRQGVVDKDCRVHGMHNLFIAGGSVFPTGGHSNPTLMIVAMAIRLAEKIKETTSHWPTS